MSKTKVSVTFIFLYFYVIFVLSMKIPDAYRSKPGQTSLEYLLLLAVVAVVVIASFGPGSLIQQVHDSAQGYYNTVTRVIMGENPSPINGGWCPVTAPSGSGPTSVYRACECPAPAFGGYTCTDSRNPNPDPCVLATQTCTGAKVTFNNVTPCGPCPTGQVCLPPDGHCGCGNGLVCGGPPNSGPTGSIPSTDCTQCWCPYGTTWDQSNNSCDANCTQPCTTWNGTSCVAVTCGANMWCNPAVPSTQECQCDQYDYYVGPGCAPCPSCQRSYDGKTCVDASKEICPPSGNWSCDSTKPLDQLCQCWQYFCPNGPTGCVPCS